MKLPTSERTTDSSPQATPFSLFQSKSWSFSPLPYILCLLSNLFCSMQVLTLLWVFGWSLCRRHLVMPIPCLKYVRDLFSLMCMERDSWSSYAWSLFNSLDISLRCLSLSLLHLSCGSSEPFTVLHRLHYICSCFFAHAFPTDWDVLLLLLYPARSQDSKHSLSLRWLPPRNIDENPYSSRYFQRAFIASFANLYQSKLDEDMWEMTQIMLE